MRRLLGPLTLAATHLVSQRIARGEHVPYSCDWLARPAIPATTCALRSDVTLALHEAARGTNLHDPRTVAALRAALAEDPAALAQTERIVRQNDALRLALSAVGNRDPHVREASALATALVDRLALPAQVLEALGSEPAAVPDWLGPRAEWTERQTLLVPLLHEQIYGLTRAFTPIHHDKTRALFSQLIAIDTARAPHITPIIGEVELRQDLSQFAPACVLELDLAAVGCEGAVRLQPTSLGEVPTSMFVQAAGPSAVACNCCHAYDGRTAPPASPEIFRPVSLSAANAPLELARRREALLFHLQERIDGLPAHAR